MFFFFLAEHVLEIFKFSVISSHCIFISYAFYRQLNRSLDPLQRGRHGLLVFNQYNTNTKDTYIGGQIRNPTTLTRIR